jgi:hypothetical protein
MRNGMLTSIYVEVEVFKIRHSFCLGRLRRFGRTAASFLGFRGFSGTTTAGIVGWSLRWCTTTGIDTVVLTIHVQVALSIDDQDIYTC